jgi:hypothetical protein
MAKADRIYFKRTEENISLKIPNFNKILKIILRLVFPCIDIKEGDELENSNCCLANYQRRKCVFST